MQLQKVYKLLDELSPFELQESWDNSGLIVGDMNTSVESIVLSIDIDIELIESCDNNALIIAHHPLIFSGLKNLDYQTYPSNLLRRMIQKNISCIAMHTNFDKTHLNSYVLTEVLGYKILSQKDFVLSFEVNENFEDFAIKIKNRLNLEYVKNIEGKKFIKTAALTTGSGASLIPSINDDCFLTGDIKYHDAMSAKSLNLSMIDIGHYESEHFFAQILEKELKILPLSVIISSSKNPFSYN